MTAQQAVRVNRPRGELDPERLRRIQKRIDAVQAAQRALEDEVAYALNQGEPLNELARQTGIAKTTLLRYSRKQ